MDSDRNSSVHLLSLPNRPTSSFPPKGAPSPNVSSPFSVLSILNEYGSWLEYRCSTEWRTQVRMAVAECDNEYLCLKYAVKMPLDWWQKQGIPDDISRLSCDNVKKWIKWRTGKTAQVPSITMDSAEEISAGSTSSCLGRLQFLGAHVGEPAKDEDVDVELSEPLATDGRRCELEEEQFERPVGSSLRARLSDFFGQTLQDFNNSESL
ncbi:hypothetical protein V8E54_011240 [Elaphomyces granulatus]